MTIRSNLDALAEAMNTTTNVPGTCQKVTRGWFNAPSAGDQDGDGDADAVDGWKSEPISARRTDRTPPKGFPVAFSGGSRGFGHRAITRDDNGGLRSTDMKDGQYTPGVTGNCTIADIEREMRVTYLGWSTTIDGFAIPVENPEPVKPTLVMLARRYLTRAMQRAKKKGNTERAAKIQKALDILPRR